MPIAIACPCGETYDLKEEFEGRLVKCPACGESLRAERPARAAQADPAFDRDKFLLRQKHLAINEKYYAWDEEGEVILFIERKAHLLRSLGAIFLAIAIIAVGLTLTGAVASQLPPAQEPVTIAILVSLTVVGAVAVAIAVSPRRHTTIYRDDTRSEVLLEILQDKKFAVINMTYSILDADQQPLAQLRKNYLYNIYRKRWNCYDAEGREMCLAMEDSAILALMRRFLGSFYGLLRTNFIIVRPGSEEPIGEFNRKFTILDRYVLDLSSDPQRSLDRRVALAMGIMLDSGERR